MDSEIIIVNLYIKISQAVLPHRTSDVEEDPMRIHPQVAGVNVDHNGMKYWFVVLTPCGLVMPYSVIELPGQHWFR